ncbi:MAG: hypothetical protein SAK29_42460, partial [Scytonema sp. PMC 1069.18]|nr:hypothetical protein [Scytonema sp. PMC 1069.18]
IKDKEEIKREHPTFLHVIASETHCRRETASRRVAKQSRTKSPLSEQVHAIASSFLLAMTVIISSQNKNSNAPKKHTFYI